MPEYLEIEGADLRGRTAVLKRAWLRPGERSVPVLLPAAAAAFPYFHVRLDGVSLEKGKPGQP